MAGLKGSLVELMSDIDKVKERERTIIGVEKSILSSDYEKISEECAMLRHVFPKGYEIVKKRYARISWFEDEVILANRLSKSASSMATAEIRSLHPDMLEFEARKMMQAQCGHFDKNGFVFDLDKARSYIEKTKEILSGPTIDLHSESNLKGSFLDSVRKRINWRIQEKEAVKRMLAELAAIREQRISKVKVESTCTTETSSSDKPSKLTLKDETLDSSKTKVLKETKADSTSDVLDITFKSDSEEILNILRNHNIRYLYHFTSQKNIPSIKKHKGLFSWHYMDTHSIDIPLPGGDIMSRNLDLKYNLQDYVRLSFCQDHPMAYRLRMAGENIVLLIIDIRAAAFTGSQYSDMNAADSRHHHGSSIDDLSRVDFDAVKRTYVSSTDPDFKTHQAEVMVKTYVPSEYILNLDDF